MRRYLIVLLLLVPVWAIAVDTPTDEKQIQRSWAFYDSLNSQWATADSGYQVCAYPSEEDDTTGKRIDFIYLGGLGKGWKFPIPDSTEVWDFYIRDACCTWQALPLHQDLKFEGRHAPEGWINDDRVFADGVIASRLALEGLVSIQTGDSSGVFRPDTLKAIYGLFWSALSVQPGDTTTTVDDLFYVDDTRAQVSVIPFIADSVHVQENAQFDANVNVDGNIDAANVTVSAEINGTSALASHALAGSVTSGDFIATDDMTAADRMTAGNALVQTYADVADSLLTGTSYVAADSMRTAAKLNGWMVNDNTYAFVAQIDNGSTFEVVKVPGARVHDTLVFAQAQDNASSTTFANVFTFAYVQGIGEIVLERTGSTGNLILSVKVEKFR